MSYTVLARKFRSQTFDEVIGQESITATLRNAISQKRVHHGYLFCGTRGVGKTSMARILAKCLNCLTSDGPTVTPCGTCDSCVSVASGEDVDVVEIDAASNTGVDNIRELRSNAVYRPARSRFKIYIIDEVHMLSTGAFNALLKTLEEPPDHVKFIFATTEPQKVPATILSRVQRFDFKSIPADDITRQLAAICRAEKVEAEKAALKRIARLANGSMRDALSLLDQVLSMCGNEITAQIVNELFPAAHDELFTDLIDRLADGDAAGAVELVDRSLGQGHGLDYWCTLLIGQIRDLMVLRVCGEETDLVDVPAGVRTHLAEQSRRFDAGAFVYMITVLEELRRSVKSSGSGRALVEAAIIRLAEAPNFSSIESLLERVAPGAATADGKRGPSPPAAFAEGRAVGSKKKRPRPVRGDAEAGTLTTPRPARPAIVTRRGPLPDGCGSEQGLQAAWKSAPADPLAPRATTGGQRMTQADVKAAFSEPMVKAAIEMFEGEIAHVQRGPAAKGADPRPANE